MISLSTHPAFLRASAPPREKKSSWQTMRLGDVCAVDKCQGVHKKLPYVGLENIESQTGQFTGSKDPVNVKSSTFKFSAEHVLYGRLRPYLNKVMLPDFEGHCSTEIFPLKPCRELSREFLQYWFLMDATVEQIDATSTGARMPRANMSEVLDFEFPLPPLGEQRRIVEILDRAFAGIATAQANAEKNRQNAHALFQSHIHAVFSQRGKGWVARRLGDVFDIGSSKRILETEWTPAGVPFYGGKEIVKLAKYGTVLSNAFISEEKYHDYATKYDMPRKGDILITARGTIGVGYVVKEGDKFYYKDGNIISMRAKTPTNPHFMLYAFASNVMADQLGRLTGTTVTHLPIEKAKELILRMPDFLVQATAVEGIQNVEAETQRLAGIYERKLAGLAALKKSLLHRAFAGEL